MDITPNSNMSKQEQHNKQAKRFTHTAIYTFSIITIILSSAFIFSRFINRDQFIFQNLFASSTALGNLNNQATSTGNILGLGINKPKEDISTSLLFLGDMMFDRGVRAQINKVGYEEVYGTFTKNWSDKYDFTIANLEGPVTSYKSKTINASGKGIPGFSFTFPTSTAAQVKASGIDIVSLANNHTENFGSDGLVQTVKYLKEANLPYFGNPTNSTTVLADEESIKASTQSPMSRIICEKLCITYIGYHEFTYENEAAITSEIKRVRSFSDVVIVMPHWGVEYEHLPNSKQKRLAHSWIDAGADAVIGAHPHVIQSFEMYSNKPIVYSLGNYIFDQYFSYHTTHGMAVALTYTASSTDSNIKNPILTGMEILPIDNTNIKTRLTGEADTKTMLKKLSDVSVNFLPPAIHEQILSGKIKF